MKSVNTRYRRRWYVACIFCILCGFYAESLFAQKQPDIPDHFIQISKDAKSLKDKLDEARKHCVQKNETGRFWLGYQFELRDGVDLDNMYIHDNGGISISHGRFNKFRLQKEDDLETYLLQALSELGVEDAREAYHKLKNKLLQYQNWHAGLFLLLDSKDAAVKKLRLLFLDEQRKFEDYPVYWGSSVATAESFRYLAEIIQNKNYQAHIVKPAIFILSLHEHPEVISFLTRTARTNDNRDIRRSAVFWLGQIPKEGSFQALVKLFEVEQSQKIKEKIVFSVSQHTSKKAFDFLAKVAKNDPDPQVREKAVFWLGQDEREESLALLSELLQNTQSTRLKEKIVFAISQHQSQLAVDLLIKTAEDHQNSAVREKAIFWLGQIAGRKSLSALGDLVENDEATEIKTKAVFAISQHQNKKEAVEMLINIAKNNKNPEVRRKAIFWLGQTGDQRAIAFFKELLTN
ncbi:MAG: HEAT repeat domain-containing protein [bacterium]